MLRTGILLVVLVTAMTLAGAAVAKEQSAEPAVALPVPLIVVDEAAGTVSIALPVDGELPDCASLQAGTACWDFALNHPSGETHRGAVVSTVAKNLHPSELEGIKKGEIMRWVADTVVAGGTENGSGKPDDGPGNGRPGNQGGGDNGGSSGGGDTPGGNGNNPGGGNENGPGDGPTAGSGQGQGNGNGQGQGNGNGQGQVRATGTRVAPGRVKAMATARAGAAVGRATVPTAEWSGRSLTCQ